MQVGQYYTRTIQILNNHILVAHGLYRITRHPGYLVTGLMIKGAGLAVRTSDVFGIVCVTGLLHRLYRIQVEEQLLCELFETGETDYANYVSKTW